MVIINRKDNKKMATIKDRNDENIRNRYDFLSSNEEKKRGEKKRKKNKTIQKSNRMEK